jgi:acyl-CoA synthetase (AMP-forming)/AMP-acid ligase II
MGKNSPMQNNVGLFLSKRAFRDPNLEAIFEPASGRRFTYREFNDRANRIANTLLDLGVSFGERVGVLLMNGVEFLETFFACGKIGAVCVPLNWRLVPDELEFILNDSGTCTLVFGSDFAGTAAELRTRRTEIRNWIEVRGAASTIEPFALDYDELTAAAGSAEPPTAGKDDDLLFIMYTSGTTGLPKGVMHTHRTVTWGILTVNATADLRYKDRYILCLPFFHVGALNPALCLVHRGGTGIVMRAFDPAQVWELIEKERITTMLAVPAMLNFMLQSGHAGRDFSSLRWIMSGAAPVPVTLIGEYTALGIEIHQVYGLTETCGPACLLTSDDAVSRAGSTGKAFFHTDVRVVADGHDCAPGEPGEVLVSGPHIMLGYWNRPEATTESVREGWLHTGDVATMDADGFVTIMDRVKDMLISGGENVYPAEIENIILSNPKVADVAVLGVPSPKWGESPLAVVVRADSSLTPEEVIAACKGRLAAFKMPKAVRFVDEIPRNPSGKILKRVLRDQFSDVAVD